MLNTSRTNAYKSLACLAFLALACSPAHSVTTTFRVWGSPWLYSVPQSEYGKVFEGSLSDGTLILHVLASATGTSAIDTASGKVVVQGEQVTLCYKMKEVKYPPNAPIPAVLYSQALEYTIAGLPKKKFSYRVSQTCE